MREALRNSVNVYAVRLFEATGIEYCWNFAKNNLGMPLREEDKVLSLSLGTAGLTTLDMASAYSTFPNNGLLNEPFVVTKVMNASGKVLYEHQDAPVRAMKETTAYLMNDMLRTVVISGTGTRAQIGSWYICGKTGTSSLPPSFGRRTGNPDAWFIGYSPHYTAAVWMGYDITDEGHYFYQQYGGNYPCRLWKEVMITALEDFAVQSAISRPNGITSVSFDTKSGLQPSALTPSGFVSSEICAADSVPTSVSEVWVERLVDPKNGLLAPEDSEGGVMRIFLDLPWREGYDEPWPGNEAGFRMPKEFSDTIGIETPPPEETDSDIPRVELGEVLAEVSSAMVYLPIVSEFDESIYSALLYVQGPNQGVLSQMVETGTRTIAYQFGDPYTLEPGKYHFWISLIDRESFTIGPPSNTYTIEVPGSEVPVNEVPVNEPVDEVPTYE
jgi:penicillin-binding protein 1A